METLSQSWHRSGVQRPLEERFAEAVVRLQKLSPGNGLCGQPRSEIALDAITDAISRLEKPPAELDPAHRAATAEMSATEQRYHRAWCEARSLQEKLRRYAKSDESRLLGNLPNELFADVGPPIDMGSHPWPRFRSTREARVAVAELLPRVLDLEGRVARLVDASRTAVESAEVLNRKMIMKLWDRVQELERQLSQAPAAANGSVRKRVKELSSSGRSTREIAEIVGCSKSTVANYLAEKGR